MIHQAQTAAAAAYHRRHMVDAQVWRSETTRDDGAGYATTWVDQNRTVPAYLIAASATEREAAQQAGVEITHVAVVPLDADLERGDRLVIGDDTVHLVWAPITATYSPIARAGVTRHPWHDQQTP